METRTEMFFAIYAEHAILTVSHHETLCLKLWMWHKNALKTHLLQSRISKMFWGFYPRTPLQGRGEEGRGVGPSLLKLYHRRCFNLPTLKYRRLWGAMIQVFNIVYGKYTPNPTVDFNLSNVFNTRGRIYKMQLTHMQIWS